MTLEVHPYAELFPLIEGEEFERFAADIRDNGLRDKIVLLDGRILDGRNRYRAALHHQLPGADGDAAWFKDFHEEAEGDPLAWVLSKNLSRRHLNESQRAVVAARLANLPSHRPAGDKSANLRTSQADAARRLNVSTRLLQSARQVLDKGTSDLVKQVVQGVLAVSQAERAARLDAEAQARVVDLVTQGKANVVRTVIKQGARAARERVLGAKQQALPDKQFGWILADPEWEHTTFSVLGLDRSPSNHYPTSTEKVIAARDVQKLAAKDCILGLWTTDLARGIRVMESWGFTFKSYFVWVKDIVQVELTDAMRDAGLVNRAFHAIGPAGTGFWHRDRCEILLIGTRGNVVAPAMGTQPESVIFAARPKIEGQQRGHHSAKPEIFHEWIEQNWPNTPKIELNARRARAGWVTWGYEAPFSADESFERAEEPQPQVDMGRAREILEKHDTARPFDPVDDLPAFLRRTPDKSSA